MNELELARWILETEREADMIVETKKREKQAEREVWLEAKNSGWKWLNAWWNIGLFADKYYHLVQIETLFPPTDDHSLNMILFTEFLKEAGF